MGEGLHVKKRGESSCQPYSHGDTAHGRAHTSQRLPEAQGAIRAQCNALHVMLLAPEMALSFACDGTSPTLRAKKEYRQQRRQQERPPPVPAYPVAGPTPAWPRQAPAQASDWEEDEEEEEEEGQVLSFNCDCPSRTHLISTHSF